MSEFKVNSRDYNRYIDHLESEISMYKRMEDSFANAIHYASPETRHKLIKTKEYIALQRRITSELVDLLREFLVTNEIELNQISDLIAENISMVKNVF